MEVKIASARKPIGKKRNGKKSDLCRRLAKMKSKRGKSLITKQKYGKYPPLSHLKQNT